MLSHKNICVDEETIPDLVQKVRKARRQLKGDQRDKMSKGAIDTLIDAYSDHLISDH